jgi:hypothetical protein
MMTWLLAEHAISVAPLSHPFFFILRTSYSTPQHTTAPVTNSPDTVDLCQYLGVPMITRWGGYAHCRLKITINIYLSLLI